MLIQGTPRLGEILAAKLLIELSFGLKSKFSVEADVSKLIVKPEKFGLLMFA